MPRARFDRLPPERRDDLLRAAGDEFAEHGFEHASVARILVAAGASKGGLYYWFEDKADLFVTVAIDQLAPLGSAVGKPGPVGSVERYWSAIASMFARGRRWLADNERELGLLRAVIRAHGSGELSAHWPRLSAPMHEIATEIVLQGQAVGAVREDLPIDLLISLALGIGESADLYFAERVDDLDPEEVAAGVEALHDVLRRVAEPRG